MSMLCLLWDEVSDIVSATNRYGSPALRAAEDIERSECHWEEVSDAEECEEGEEGVE
jgi:hypothetical protein